MGLFGTRDQERATEDALPSAVTWVRQAAAGFEPASDAVVLADGSQLRYSYLVAAPGIQLNWGAVEGLPATLGSNGVTSNYKQGLAEGYTWPQVQALKRGKAIFTQPPMPIKCAGAPQKAAYLSADTWRAAGVLGDISIDFHLAGPALFGVKEFVPPLTKYIEASRRGSERPALWTPTA